MNINESLLRDIEQIIAALQQEQAALKSGSTAYTQKAAAITAFSTALSKLRGDISVSKRELGSLVALLDRITSGENVGRTRLSGQRLSYSTIKSAVETTIPSVESLVENVPTTSRYANVGGVETPGQADKIKAKADKEKAALDKATESLEKALIKREKAVAKFTLLQEKLEGLYAANPNTPTPLMVVPEAPIVDGADNISIDPKKRAGLVRKETAEIEKAYNELTAKIKAQEALVNDAFKTRKQTIRVEDDVVARTIRQRTAERKKAVEESARTEQEALDEINKQTPIRDTFGDRFDAAINGRETLFRQEEQNIVRERELAQRREEFNKKNAEANSEFNKRLEAFIREKERLVAEETRIAEHRQKMLNLENSLPGGKAATENLDKKAAAIDPNFTRESIKRVSIEGSSGVAKVQYEYATTEGVIKKATFTVDKFGKVLEDIPRRLQGFGSQIMKNIRESIAWGAAIGLVYGAMNQLNQLIDVAIRNQSALADIEITLANATQTTFEIFEASSKIAQETGESLDGVIEAYNQAYRATGGISDGATRFATANKLLSDSLVLSKLSTLNQTEAIDTMSAALRQAGMSLDSGTVLLDKWVAVTKSANVDLTTLATGFAVLGDAAESAGLDADKLNAVIALVAETSISSGKEVANTARALVAGFQSDQARKELTMLGVSVEDATGKTRGFLDIVSELRDLQRGGIIDETQFSKLTLALGGGTRRQAAFSSFISNSDRLANIEAASLAAGGDAAEALGKKLDTVETATTRLGNSFQSLAQSVGESGGILDIFTMLLNILNGVTKGLADVMQMAGKAGPVVAAALASMAAIKYTSGGAATIYNTVGNIGRDLAGGYAYMQAKRQGSQFPTLAAQAAGQRGGQFAQAALPWAGAAAGIAVPAIENLMQGKMNQAAGNAIGGVIAGGIGYALGGPVGAAIGSTLGASIGEAFVNYADSWKPDFSGITENPFSPANSPDATKKTAQEQAQEKLIQKLEDMAGFNTGARGVDQILNKLESGLFNLAAKFTYGDKFSGLSDAQSLLVKAGFLKNEGRISEKDFNDLLEEIRRLSNTDTTEKKFSSETPQLLQAERKQQEEMLRGLVQTGQLGMAGYRQGMENLGGLSASAQQYYPLVGKQLGGEQQFYDILGNITARGSVENLAELSGLKQDINDTVERIKAINEELASIPAGTDKYVELTNERLQKTQYLEDATSALANRFVDLNNQILSSAKLMDSVDFKDVKFAPGFSLDKLKKDANAEYRNDLMENVKVGGLTEEEMQAIMDNTADTLIKGYADVAENTPASYLTDMLNKWKDEGKVTTESAASKLGFQTFDITQPKLESVINGPEYSATAKRLEALGYKMDEQTQIAITSEGNINSYKKDWKVVQYLLQEILKVDQKQLDGMYNLPEGASFWVPAQAAKMSAETGAAMGTGDTSAFGSAVSEFGSAVTQFSDQMRLFRQGDQASMDAYNKMQQNQPKSYTPTAAEYEKQMNLFRQGEQASLQTKSTGGIPLPPNYDKTLVDYYRNRTLDLNPKENQVGMFEQVTKAISDAVTTPINTMNKSINDFFMGLFNSNGLKQQSSTEKPSDLFTSATMPSTATSSSATNNFQDLGSIIAQGVSNLSTKLSLTIDSRTIVQVDGRQIAAVVKQYLKNDLLKYSGGNATKQI